MNIVDARQMSEATPGALRLEQVAVGIPMAASTAMRLRTNGPSSAALAPTKYTTSVVSWGAVFNTSSTR